MPVTSIELKDSFRRFFQSVDFIVADFDFSAVEFVSDSDVSGFRDPFHPFQGDYRLVLVSVVTSVWYDTDRLRFQEQCSVDPVAGAGDCKTSCERIDAGFLKHLEN